MKKFTFLIFFVGLFTVSACSGNSGTKAATKENTEGEVVQLTGESFQKLIWDYKKNPNDWSLPVISHASSIFMPTGAAPVK